MDEASISIAQRTTNGCVSHAAACCKYQQVREYSGIKTSQYANCVNPHKCEDLRKKASNNTFTLKEYT